MAFGGELPVIADDNTAFLPISDVNGVTKAEDNGTDWYGLGGHVSFAATDDLTLTARAAYLSDDRTDNNSLEAYTAGLNVQFQNFFIAALYGETDADVNSFDETETQVYASYKIPAIMDIDNFDIYLGAGWSEAEKDGVTQDDVVGGRVRLKYIF